MISMLPVCSPINLAEKSLAASYCYLPETRWCELGGSHCAIGADLLLLGGDLPFLCPTDTLAYSGYLMIKIAHFAIFCCDFF